MKRSKSTNFAAMVVGAIGMIFGVYGLINGEPIEEYGFTLFIGLVLFGVAFINQQQLKKKGDQ